MKLLLRFRLLLCSGIPFELISFDGIAKLLFPFFDTSKGNLIFPIVLLRSCKLRFFELDIILNHIDALFVFRNDSFRVVLVHLDFSLFQRSTIQFFIQRGNTGFKIIMNRRQTQQFLLGLFQICFDVKDRSAAFLYFVLLILNFLLGIFLRHLDRSNTFFRLRNVALQMPDIIIEDRNLAVLLRDLRFDFRLFPTKIVNIRGAFLHGGISIADLLFRLFDFVVITVIFHLTGGNFIFLFRQILF